MKSSNSSFYAGFRGASRAFRSKGRPLSPASAYLELLSQKRSIWHIFLRKERFEIDLTQTDLDLTQTDLDLTQTREKEILKFNIITWERLKFNLKSSNPQTPIYKLLDLTQTDSDLTQTDSDWRGPDSDWRRPDSDWLGPDLDLTQTREREKLKFNI